ncbi:MAG TPA: hypothetical protein VFO42_03570 [Sphingomicrobium sp.]|nr:hypothetical protein [Sphingomicrobium sp.]
MTDDRRRPHADNDLIDELTEVSTPSQSGASGGAIQRDIAGRDDFATATGADPQPTSVHKSDKPDGGDAPNLPNRDGGGEESSRSGPSPRRT